MRGSLASVGTVEVCSKEEMAGKGKKIGIGCGVIVAIAAAFLFLSPPGKAVIDLWKNGNIQAVVFKPEQKSYAADNEANLKSIYTALSLYHDSEGQFPVASGWMDAVENRLQSNDLKPGEGKKKLKNPAAPEGYGYGFNQDASGKFKDELKDKTMILVYESKLTSRNASGAPTVAGRGAGSLGITIEGKIVNLR